MTGTLLPIDGDTPLQEVHDVVRAWLETSLPQTWREAAGEGGLDVLRRVRSRADYEAWYPTFAASGLAVPHWPREYGGLEVGSSATRAIDEELRPFNIGRLNILGINLVGTTLLEWGTDEQRQRFLPPIVRNEEHWCQLFSEPGAGSDLASLATLATRDGDEWVVSGQKVWTTWARDSELGILLARTNTKAPKRSGVTCFCIDMRQPGVTVRPLRQMTGEADFNEVFLDGARIPDADRIGPVDGGWRVANTTLSGERQMIGGPGSGGLDRLSGRSVERLVERARDVARARPGGSGWDDVRFRRRLMALYSTERVLAWTNLRARAARSAGRAPGPEASIGKLASAEHNLRVQAAWVDLLGASALAWNDDDVDVKRVVYGFLRSRANTIEGGTSEVHRTILGERVLGLPREPDPYADRPWSDVPRN